MTIGQLADAAGVNVETIRYYQRRGLMEVPSRPLGGQRKYNDESLRRIAFIRRAQDLGFTLEEITGLIAMARNGDCRDGGEAAKRKYEELGSRLAELERMRGELARLVGRCEERRFRGACPVIRYLEGDAEA